jgi:hypothetical protein
MIIIATRTALGKDGKITSVAIDIMIGSITIGTETMQIHTLVKRTICPMPNCQQRLNPANRL